MTEPELHDLLRRQLRKLLGSGARFPAGLGPLVATISETYRQADLDRDLLERALDLTSEELLEANEKLRAHTRELEAKVAARTKALRETNRDLDRQIRERVEAERARHETEQRYRALAEHSPTGIFHSDADGMTLYVNDAWCRITGLSKAEAMGDGWKQAIHPWDRDKKSTEWSDLVHHGEGLSGGEYRILRPNGDIVWAEGYAVALKDEHGRATGFVGSVHDITEHKLAQEIIRESEERYRTLFEQSLDCIYISSPDGQFIDVNPAGLKLLGLESKQEALEADIAKFYSRPEDRQALLLELEERGTIVDRELQLKRADGSPITVIASITTVQDANGSIQTMRGIMRDVSETRQMERQLRQSQKMEAVGRLAGGVAHDFNNLLTAIIGYADLLTMNLPTETAMSRDAREIKSIARRGASLTKQLLTFSRHHAVAQEQVRLNDVVSNLLGILRRLLGEDVELKTDLADELGIVSADRTQIEQIIVNLAINARDAMPDGGRLQIRTDPFDSRGPLEPRYAGLPPARFVRLCVADEGSGIDPQIQERIFEPFFSTKPDSQGTGLGLSTVYGAVKQNDGYIFLTSEPDTGTTFEILLPEVTAETSTQTERPQHTEAAGGSETILIAEDEPTVRQFLASLLTSQGYSVLTAANGQEALEKAHAYDAPIDLLLSDIVMPKMNGIELARMLRSQMRDLKILLITGYSDNQVPLREIGDAYLMKPFAPQALTKRLRQLLDGDRVVN